MSISDQLQTLARREYALLRTVAKAVDERLEPAVSGSPGLTSALTRVREVLQDIDERVTGSDPAAAPSSEPTSRPRSQPKTAEPEPVAVHEDEDDDDDDADDDDADDDDADDDDADDDDVPEAAEPEEVEHLAEELLEEEDDHHTGELADNEDLRDVQARLRAKHALQEFNEKQT